MRQTRSRPYLPADISRRQRLRLRATRVRPGPNFEEIDKKRGLWPARITRGCGVLEIREGSEIAWF
jgi:hypothetical protein